MVLYDDGTLNGYKNMPTQQEIVELGGKLENQFTVKSTSYLLFVELNLMRLDVSILRLDDGLHFKIRCRQQNRTIENASVERNFRSMTDRADRDSWCDDIERICTEVSDEMIVDALMKHVNAEIDMPMATELKDASKRLTMFSFERIKRQSLLIRGTHTSLFSPGNGQLWPGVSSCSQE